MQFCSRVLPVLDQNRGLARFYEPTRITQHCNTWCCDSPSTITSCLM